MKDMVGMMLREAWRKNGTPECLHPERSPERSFSGVTTGFDICTTCGKLMPSQMQEQPTAVDSPLSRHIIDRRHNRDLRALALKVWRQDNGMYRGKALCRVCVLAKASLTCPEDMVAFEQIWDRWGMTVKRDRCVVCGEVKETMTVSG